MRDAFGGLFMLRLMLIFIFIYLVFAAISYNYAQAFKLKNSIISYIEEKDIVDFGAMANAGDGSILSGIDKILTSYTYGVTCDKLSVILERQDDLDPQKFCYRGIVLEAEEKDNIVTYKVNTFVYMNLPLLNRFYMFAANNNSKHVKEGAIQITGEAKVIHRKEPYAKPEIVTNGATPIFDETSSNPGENSNTFDNTTTYTNTQVAPNPGANNSTENSDNPGANYNNDAIDNPGANVNMPENPTSNESTPLTIKVPVEHTFTENIPARNEIELDAMFHREYSSYCQRFNGRFLGVNYNSKGYIGMNKQIWQIIVICEETRE